jgi:hypothetical protein
MAGEEHESRWVLCASGLCIYSLTTVIVLMGVQFGCDYIGTGNKGVGRRSNSPFSNWDGKHYLQIAENGYRFDEEKPSTIAFFPALPLCARALSGITGWSAELALVLIANGALAFAFIALFGYLRSRCRATSNEICTFAGLAFGLWPTSFFFRMAYSESLLLLALASVLYGISRRWPIVIISLIVGAGTAARPVGIALVPPLILVLWQSAPSIRAFAIRLLCVMPLSLWGLAAFMIYQAITFGDPLAFARAQTNWRLRPIVPISDKVDALVTLEPIWSVYVPTSCCYGGTGSDVFFNLRFANPVFFLLAVALTAYGAWRNWLHGPEIVLVAGLLAIPYFTRSHEMCMCSMGRFSAVAIPVYVVLGHLLYQIPHSIAVALLATSATLMAFYAALFAAGYPLI